MSKIDEMIEKSGIRGRLTAAANGMHPLKTDRGDYGILEDALDEINRLRAALTVCANHADNMPRVVKAAVEALADQESSDGS